MHEKELHISLLIIQPIYTKIELKGKINKQWKAKWKKSHNVQVFLLFHCPT